MNSIFQQRNCLTQREVKQYLNGELNDEQRYEVENHLLDCELCSAAVDGYAENQDFDSFDEDIQLVRSKVDTAVKGPPRRRLSWVNRAAAAVLILILGYAAFRYWDASQPERIFAAYFEPTPNTYITYRSDGSEGAPDSRELAQALSYYDAEAFALSLPHFQNYLEDRGDDARALMLAASACLQAGQAEQAEQYLLQLEAREEPTEGQAAWYLALAYLKQGKMAPARVQLELILADPASPFRAKAQEVLERMQ